MVNVARLTKPAEIIASSADITLPNEIRNNIIKKPIHRDIPANTAKNADTLSGVFAKIKDLIYLNTWNNLWNNLWNGG